MPGTLQAGRARPASTGNSASMRRTATSPPPRPTWWPSSATTSTNGGRTEPRTRRARGAPDESLTLADYRARYAQYKSRPATCRPPTTRRRGSSPGTTTKWPTTTRTTATSALDPAFCCAPRGGLPGVLRAHAAAPARRCRTATRICACYQRYDWGRLARFHVLDDRQYRSHQACARPGRGGSHVGRRAPARPLQTRRARMLGATQEAWLAQGLRASPARWNILAQQTLMAQSQPDAGGQPDGGRFWTDGWDGYPAARNRLLDMLARHRRSQSAGAVRRRAHVLSPATCSAISTVPASRRQPGAGDRILRHVGDVEFAAAVAHRAVPGDESAYPAMAAATGAASC